MQLLHHVHVHVHVYVYALSVVDENMFTLYSIDVWTSMLCCVWTALAVVVLGLPWLFQLPTYNTQLSLSRSIVCSTT